MSHIGMYLVGKLINGVLTDNVGEKPIIIFGMALQAFATIGFGFSNTFVMFAFCWSVMSYCQSFAGIIQTKLVCNWFPQSKMGRIFGILNSASEIIGTIGYLGFGTILNVSAFVNWRMLFWICGAIILCILLIGLGPLKAHPSDVGLSPPEVDGDAPTVHPFDRLSSMQALVEFFKSPRFWILLVLQIADGPFVSIPGDWTTYLLKSRYGVNEGNATMATSVLAFSRCLGVILGGIFYDFLSIRNQIGFFTITAALSTAFWLTIGFWQTIPIGVLIPFLGLYSFFVAPTYYLAGQFFSVVFGGERHCGFMDSLKDLASGTSSMIFSFI
jgi:sugar phosphate permease